MEKTPRMRPHETITESPEWRAARMTALGNLGVRMYHPLNPDQQRAVGQLSLRREAQDGNNI